MFGWQGYLIAAGAALVIGFGGGYATRDGFANVAEIKRLKGDIASINATRAKEAKAEKLTAEIGGAASEQQSATRVEYRTLIQKVPFYVTAQADRSATVPVGFVRLHDEAANGSKVPDTAAEPNDAPSGLALSTVAATVVDNYGLCKETRDNYIALQSWVTSQALLSKEP